jgi:photosystem II stability/assembly factor-like uncharacterized protein
VAPDRIVLQGAPPWDYGDYLDDDPHFLDRYWAGRAAPSSGVAIRWVPRPRLVALRVDGMGRAWAVGHDGVVLRRGDGGDAWRVAGPLPLAPAGGAPVDGAPVDGRRAMGAAGVELHDVTSAGDRVIVLGTAGRWLVSDDAGRHWRPGPAPSADSAASDLRAVAFAPDGALGIAIGARGATWRSLDAGRHWEAVDMAPQARQSVVR